MKIDLLTTTAGICAAAIAALGIACAPVPAPAPTPAANATVVRAYANYLVGGMSVREFTLSDGTRCVAYPGTGITCEWQQPVVLVPRVE